MYVTTYVGICILPLILLPYILVCLLNINFLLDFGGTTIIVDTKYQVMWTFLLCELSI